MSSSSQKGRGQGHGQGQRQGHGQRQRQRHGHGHSKGYGQGQSQSQSQSKSQTKPDQLEMSVNGANTTKQVELAMHAKTAPEALTNNQELTVDFRQPGHLSSAEPQNAEESPDLDLDKGWDRALRILTRCLMYCTGRIAAGFGLSRQQTAWYKHCWDNPGQRPRGISFLGAPEDYLPPGGAMSHQEPTI
ncbi:hypothetical protein ACLKA7_006801 [Drosophila subpalustris]